MQFSSILALFASVAVISAAPTAWGEGGSGGSSSSTTTSTNTGEQCPAGKQQSCCKNSGESGILGGLLGGSCELNILGQDCSGNIQCCQADDSGSILSSSCGPLLSL